jgi:cobaltochelatase CobT
MMALLDSAAAGDLSRVKSLLAQGADVNARAVDGATALFLASLNGHRDVVQYLLDANAEVNAKADRGATALIVASQKGHLSVVKALIAANAEISAKGDNGLTALFAASQNGHLDVVEALLKAKADHAAAAPTVASQRGHQQVVPSRIAPLIPPQAPEQRQPASYDPNKPYLVYCRDFDVEVHANMIDSILGPSPVDSATLRKEFLYGISAWQLRHDFASLDAAERILNETKSENLKDTVVSLLVDHSGSMRGQKMLLAAGSMVVAADLLEKLNITFEVLGFTTARWRGGCSRERWLKTGRPSYPGRLNDLLHIIYKSADQRQKAYYGNMIREDVLKENVDGEALAWAATRLRNRPENRKHLFIISDGAPVDDSTLMENGENYLAAHLKAVIRDIARTGDITVSAIGIDYDVGRYYQRSTVVRSPQDLGAALLSRLEEALCSPPR